eukprot:CAMPEP_0178928068 /NCGR_PEP_ID=MMETSP0786-20121207/19634_1 /TAXON_ID=186022 /ORGANISM="Thalassionema frauenfeldii, Strain CCMP 1798" /LENGTH=265 /DNA_ID=CAMNT_0020603763 /DNA_START=375 /DNA_END=1168 /DNA_ORIENTATION=-
MACVKVQKYVDDDGSIRESNKTINDIATLILDEMYEELQGRNQVHDLSTDSKNDGIRGIEHGIKVSESDFSAKRRPEEWMFAGYMAFMLFGPMAPRERRIDFFQLKDRNFGKQEITLIEAKKNYSAFSEAKSKKKEIIELNSRGDQKVNLEKDASANDGSNGKENKTATVDIHTTQLKANVQNGDFFALKTEAAFLECQIDRAFRLAEKSRKDADWDRYNKLELEMDTIRKTMKDLRQASHGFKRTHDLIEPNIHDEDINGFTSA